MLSNWTPSPEMLDQLDQLTNSDLDWLRGALRGEMNEAAWIEASEKLARSVLATVAELGHGRLGIVITMRTPDHDWGACFTNMPKDVAATSLKRASKQLKRKAIQQ